ncbi:MAG TPA: DUF2795 domain-containing protein [Streptosporangiaceae bacterium]|nr:DUF2795 domain-containing protein [Streptosporangiaceae bacterium]
MSEQVSGTHGPAEDDAIKRQDRNELQAHGDEWPEPESAGDDATWASPGRFVGTPGFQDWEAIELRSDLARHLDRATFPATRVHLLETLTAHEADERLLDLVSSVPDRARFASLGELLRALGLPVETRPG